MIERVLDCDSTNIVKCCKGKYKHILNYVWRYEGDSFDKYETPTIPKPKEIKVKEPSIFESIPVISYYYNGKVRKIYRNIIEASKDTGINKVNIIKCCRGQQITSGKRIWRFKGDDFNKYNTEIPKRPIRLFTEEEKRIMRDKALEYPYTKKVSKRVGVYDLNGNFIKEIPSVTQATKEYGSGVAFVLRGEYSQIRGYKFKLL